MGRKRGRGRERERAEEERERDLVSCFIEFKNLEPINAVVNSTVQVECRSNCTPHTLLHMKRPGDISSERSIGTLKTNRNDPYPYIITDTIHLDISYNDTWLVCKVITGSSNRSVQITLQGQLQHMFVCVLLMCYFCCQQMN